MSDTMTTEIRDWHARRAGWNPPGTKPEPTGDFVRDSMRQTLASDSWWMIVGKDFRRSAWHPFPATLDGADASFPPGYQWIRVCRVGGSYEWIAQKYHGIRSAAVDATGNKIHDLYALSRLAWEQEAAS